jgi:hypothetical protein
MMQRESDASADMAFQYQMNLFLLFSPAQVLRRRRLNFGGD